MYHQHDNELKNRVLRGITLTPAEKMMFSEQVDASKVALNAMKRHVETGDMIAHSAAWDDLHESVTALNALMALKAKASARRLGMCVGDDE